HILILKIDPEGADLVAASREDLGRMRAQGASWSENDLLRLLRIASDVLTPMRDSPQPLVHLEAAILQMATLESGETLAELLARLESLEQRLASGGSSGESTPPRGPGPGAPARPAPARVTLPPATSTGSLAARAAAPGVATVATLADEPMDCSAGVEERWREVLAAINRRKRLLGAFLEESVFLGRASDRVVVAMDDLHRAVVEEKDNRGIVTEELRRAFGEERTLLCSPEDALGQNRDRQTA